MSFLIVIFVIIIALLLLASYFFFRFACFHDKQKDIEQNSNNDSPWKEFQNRHLEDFAYLQSFPKEDYEIISFDKKKLHAIYVKGKMTKRIVVCAHGYKGKAEDDFSGAARFLLEDSDLLLIDERTCGQSEGKYITFGALEQKDIIQWTEWINQNKNIKKVPIYLYGISLGGASVCMASNHNFPIEVKGIIDDCGYSSMEDICNELAKNWFHVPGFIFIPFVNWFAEKIADFSIYDANAKKSLENSTLPVLFIHGTSDDFVIPENSKRNYDACTNKKDIVYINGATHAISYYKDSKLYIESVKSFFEKYD